MLHTPNWWGQPSRLCIPGPRYWHQAQPTGSSASLAGMRRKDIENILRQEERSTLCLLKLSAVPGAIESFLVCERPGLCGPANIASGILTAASSDSSSDIPPFRSRLHGDPDSKGTARTCDMEWIL